MKTYEYIRISNSDPRHMLNMQRELNICDVLKSFDKEVRKLDTLGVKVDVTTFHSTMMAEFNVGDRWYVINQYLANTWSLQENLKNGDIEYIIDGVSFVKMFNQAKKLV